MSNGDEKKVSKFYDSALATMGKLLDEALRIFNEGVGAIKNVSSKLNKFIAEKREVLQKKIKELRGKKK